MQRGLTISCAQWATSVAGHTTMHGRGASSNRPLAAYRASASSSAAPMMDDACSVLPRPLQARAHARVQPPCQPVPVQVQVRARHQRGMRS